jgi:CRISPR-associated protein Cas1
VEQAVLYYAAEKRRLNVVVDDALKSEALATLQAARTAADGPRPMPLVNDPRCPRCSLFSVCLPDEVNFHRGAASTRELSRRKVWPPRDDGIHLVAQNQGSKIGVNGQSMKITDYAGTTLRQIPLANVESLALLGSVQISTQAIHVLAERGIPVALLSVAGRAIAVVDPLDAVSADTRRAQVRRFDDPAARLELSRALVVAKIVNQRTLLLRNHDSLPPRLADDLAAQADAAKNAATIDAVRGHEGQAAALYFQHFAGMIRHELAAEFAQNGRQRRPPPDPINAVLSLAYTMLTHECVAALRVASLEPSIGPSTFPGPAAPPWHSTCWNRSAR